ncbi:MAG: hypothetical protein Q9180_009113, partial [Flavoplaca navasiana]
MRQAAREWNLGRNPGRSPLSVLSMDELRMLLETSGKQVNLAFIEGFLQDSHLSYEFLKTILDILAGRKPDNDEYMFEAQKCIECRAELIRLCFSKDQHSAGVNGKCYFCQANLLDFAHGTFEYITSNLPPGRKFDFRKLADFILDDTNKRTRLDETDLAPIEVAPTVGVGSNAFNPVHTALASQLTSSQSNSTAMSAPAPNATAIAKIYPAIPLVSLPRGKKSTSLDELNRLRIVSTGVSRLRTNDENAASMDDPKHTPAMTKLASEAEPKHGLAGFDNSSHANKAQLPTKSAYNGLTGQVKQKLIIWPKHDPLEHDPNAPIVNAVQEEASHNVQQATGASSSKQSA